MNLLEINNGKATFVKGNAHIKPEELSRDDILFILNSIYENESENVIFPEDEQITSISNPVEREIVKQIIEKIKEFNENVEIIRLEVQSQFPLIEED